jgi:hypothetical protein
MERSTEEMCVYSNLYFIDSNGTRIGKRDRRNRPGGNIQTYLASGKMSLLRSMIAPLDQVKRIGGLDKRYPKHDGFILTLQLAKIVSYAYVPEPLAEYRLHTGGDSKTYGSTARVGYLESVYERVQDLCDELTPKERKFIDAIWFYRLLRWSWRSNIETKAGLPSFIPLVFRFFQNSEKILPMIFYKIRNWNF